MSVATGGSRRKFSQSAEDLAARSNSLTESLEQLSSDLDRRLEMLSEERSFLVEVYRRVGEMLNPKDLPEEVEPRNLEVASHALDDIG